MAASAARPTVVREAAYFCLCGADRRARGAFHNPGGRNALPASELDGCLVARADSERAAERDVRIPQKAARCPQRHPRTCDNGKGWNATWTPDNPNGPMVGAGGHERQHPRAATSVRQRRTIRRCALRAGCERGTRGLRGASGARTDFPSSVSELTYGQARREQKANTRCAELYKE